MTLRDEIGQSAAPGLDRSVAHRILVELGPAGERVLRCLRTARWLLESSAEGADDVRFGESAAYNLREALDSVVRDRPAGEGGLRAALAAWEQYELACSLPGSDEPTARAALAAVLDGLARDRQHQAYMTRRLLDWFQQQTGLTPIAGADDPTVQYQRLRDGAAAILHGDASSAEVEGLYRDVIAWFTRFFAPPSDIIRQIEQLAPLPFSAERFAELRRLAMNANHLRMFLGRVEDPNWLEPMRQVGLIGLPVSGEVWPVTALTGEAHRLADIAVAGLLLRLMDDLSTLQPSERPTCAFDIARAAWWLGPPGHPIVLELLRRFPTVDLIQAIAISVAEELDPIDPAVVEVADAVIGNEPGHRDGGRARELVARLIHGMTEDNVDERFGLIAVKLRRLAAEDPYLSLDIVALHADGVDKSEPVLDMAHRLAAAIPKCKVLGMSTSSMLAHVAGISGELGERLCCQVFAGAADIDRPTKLAHLARRLVSHTATGDDRELLEDVLPLDDQEITMLREAFGSPPQAPAESEALNDDSARAWRWSMLLPSSVLAGWDEAIAAVTALHGSPDASALDRRTPMLGARFGSSPISPEDLAASDPVEAAARVAAWRPSTTDPWGVSARELARTLESLVKDEPEVWTDDPIGIVRTLREPVYVDHYFRAVKASAAKIGKRAPALIRAIEFVRRERWEPAILGNDDFDFEADWTSVDRAAVELVDALADANADLAPDLDLCWQLATELAEDLPDDLGSADDYVDASSHDDPLHGAINSAHGIGLQAVLALGGWEHRNLGAASDRLASSLSKVLAVDGAVGLELRAVVAAGRPFVETIAPDWIEHNHDALFGDELLGQVTLDQSLKYSRPTKAFYDRSLERLLNAARRGADHAVAWLLIAYLWDEPGYSFDRIVDGLAGNESSLEDLSRELARLTTDVPADQPEIAERGLAVWRQLLAQAGDRIPVASLAGLGGWALNHNLDPTTWLEMTEQTSALTGGQFTHATEVAERCRDLQPSVSGLRILAELVGHGERWEQHHIESIGVAALHAAANAGLTDDAFDRLRERLIQRGRHEAVTIAAHQRGP